MDNFVPSGKIISKKEREMLRSLDKRWCGSCRSVKDIIDFSGGSTRRCKACAKKLYELRKVKYPNYSKDYCKKHKERKAAYNKKWNRNPQNKRNKLDFNRAWLKEKLKNDPSYRIRYNLRSRFRFALKNKRNDSIFNLIGCSIDELRIHLEKQFKEGMSWENYGNPNGDHSNCWHIDHIQPCASFDLSDPEQQKKCFHFSNLQPLWAKENLAKGCRWLV